MDLNWGEKGFPMEILHYLGWYGCVGEEISTSAKQKPQMCHFLMLGVQGSLGT